MKAHATELERWVVVTRRPRSSNPRQEWDSLLARSAPAVSTAAAGDWFDTVVKSYTGPARSYHNIRHVRNVIA